MALRSKSCFKSSENGEVRALVERRPFRSTGGAFLPHLMTSHVEHESPIERALLIHLLLCEDVTQISSQKLAIEYVGVNGKITTYTPDFTVSVNEIPTVLEAKALIYLLRPDSIEKYAAIARHYRKEGTPYHFIVDAQLEEMPRAANVKLLFRYASCSVPDSVKMIALRLLKAGAKSIRYVCDQGNVNLVDIYTLIANKTLSINWNQPLCIDALVSLPGKSYGGLKIGDILSSTRFGGVLEELALGRRPEDQRLLALAKNWRQRVCSLHPLNFAG